MKLINISYCVAIDHNMKPIFKFAMINLDHVVDIDYENKTIYMINKHKYVEVSDNVIEKLMKGDYN